MMRRYVVAYAVWLAAVLAGGYAALAWYRHVEKIGWRELAERTKDGNAGNESNG